jgi:hypothetical protein
MATPHPAVQGEPPAPRGKLRASLAQCAPKARNTISPERRDRLWLLNALAVALLALLGAAGEALGFDKHLKPNGGCTPCFARAVCTTNSCQPCRRLGCGRSWRSSQSSCSSNRFLPVFTGSSEMRRIVRSEGSGESAVYQSSSACDLGARTNRHANPSMPPQHRFGLHNNERIAPTGEPPIGANPELSVRIAQARLRVPALQHQ